MYVVDLLCYVPPLLLLDIIIYLLIRLHVEGVRLSVPNQLTCAVGEQCRGMRRPYQVELTIVHGIGQQRHRVLEWCGSIYI